jgi:diguanylate cyclase (GGDEF)-like protein
MTRLPTSNGNLGTVLEFKTCASKSCAITRGLEIALSAARLKLKFYEAEKEVSLRKEHGYQVEIHDLRERNVIMEKAADIDPLTGLQNKGAFDAILTQIYAASGRSKKPFGVLMLDLDGFKQMNDRHGHAVGDDLLKLISRLLKKCVRKSAVVTRWGGDEFGIILPECSPRDVHMIAEEIRDIVYASAKELGYSYSASIGVISATQKTPLYDLLPIADTALYFAKGKRLKSFAQQSFHDATGKPPKNRISVATFDEVTGTIALVILAHQTTRDHSIEIASAIEGIPRLMGRAKQLQETKRIDV